MVTVTKQLAITHGNNAWFSKVEKSKKIDNISKDLTTVSNAMCKLRYKIIGKVNFTKFMVQTNK